MAPAPFNTIIYIYIYIYNTISSLCAGLFKIIFSENKKLKKIAENTNGKLALKRSVNITKVLNLKITRKTYDNF